MAKYQFDDVDGLKGAISDEFGDWGPEVVVTHTAERVRAITPASAPTRSRVTPRPLSIR